MAYNCKIQLNGNLGQDPKQLESNGKKFISLRIATTDSYPKKEGETTVWVDSGQTLWHDVLIFSPKAIEAAEQLKKGDLVEIVGRLSYRTFKDENGHNKQQASVIGNFIQKIEFNKDETDTEMNEATA